MTVDPPPQKAEGLPPPVEPGSAAEPPAGAGEAAGGGAVTPAGGGTGQTGQDGAAPRPPQPDPPANAWMRLRAAAGAFALPIFLTLVVLIYTVPSKRSLGVEAVTGGALIRHTGAEAGRWILPRATLCVRKRGVQEPPGASDEPHPACDRLIYWTVPVTDADFFWPAGTQTLVRRTANGGLSVDIQAVGDRIPNVDGVSVGANSRLLVPPSTWRSHAALPIAGDLTLGLLPSGGEEGYVRDGRYLVREPLLLRTRPVTVVEGDLFPGDQVQFEGWTCRLHALLGLAPDRTQRAMGFIAPAKNRGAFTVVAYTEVGWSRMRVDRIAAEPSFVEVGWTSRALRDPVLLALTAIVGLFVLLPTPRLARRRAHGRF